MTKRFYLAGHNNFGNRGCEALVRSIVFMLRSKYPNAEILVPSYQPKLDLRQWPTADTCGVQFVQAESFPNQLRWRHRLAKLIPGCRPQLLKFRYRSPAFARTDVEGCDAIVMTGGDVITLDYGLPSLLWNTAFIDQFLSGKPTMLWAASTGPFSQDTAVERHMARFLQRLPAITVRETLTEHYLRSIGVSKNVSLVTDPAFVLQTEAFDCSSLWPNESDEGVLGLNISPLICKFRHENDATPRLQDEIAQFIRHVLRKKDMSVLLIPHVDPLNGDIENSDSAFMAEIYARIDNKDGRCKIAPRDLNAAQLKYLLGKCRFFIGARTHATIGSLSSGVPTLSIAYSTKARGLNKDLFGHERYVLETPRVSEATLLSGLNRLLNEESAIKSWLSTRIPVWKNRAHESLNPLVGML